MPTLTSELKTLASVYARAVARDIRAKCQPGEAIDPRHLPILCVGASPCHQSIFVSAGRGQDGAPWAEVDGLLVDLTPHGPIYWSILGAICRRMLDMDATAPGFG